MQLITLFQSLIFLRLLSFGQAAPPHEKRSDISCCALGTEFTTAVDTCQYWDQCDGGYTTCTTSSREQALCSQCLYNPTYTYCELPVTQSKKARDLETRDLETRDLETHDLETLDTAGNIV